MHQTTSLIPFTGSGMLDISLTLATGKKYTSHFYLFLKQILFFFLQSCYKTSLFPQNEVSTYCEWLFS